MKRINRILTAFGFIILILISWAVVLGSKSADEIQTELISQAVRYIEDEIYIRAVPLLEEAAGYNAAHTFEAETLLKNVYIQLMDQRGYRRRYIQLLEKQMNHRNAPAEVFVEAAHFYLDSDNFRDAFAVLRNGIAKTGSYELTAIYESNRYVYRIGSNVYEDVTASHGSTIGVQWNGLWGVAHANGTLRIPCIYEQVSTFSNGRAIVLKDGTIFAVDPDNNRIALLKEDVSGFGNLSNNRLSLLIDGKWYWATGSFAINRTAFEEVGTYFNNHAPAKQNGRWGVIDFEMNWLLPPEHDGIVMDELGRAFAQNAVFVQKGNSVFLYVNGNQTAGPFENARPFGGEHYAAVQKDGLWGFINTAGEIKIAFAFEDALSFGQHLAAVRQGDFWGYISLSGDVVIEPVFLQAKSFANGSAPVQTERGWQFITLHESMRGAGL